MALLLLTFVAPLQMFPSIMEFVGRDTDGGTTFGIFGVAWSRRPDIAFRRRQTKRYDRTFFDKTGRVFPCADAADFDEQTAAWTLLGISVFRTLEMLPLNSNWASHISCNWHNRTRAMRDWDLCRICFPVRGFASQTYSSDSSKWKRKARNLRMPRRPDISSDAGSGNSS